MLAKGWRLFIAFYGLILARVLYYELVVHTLKHNQLHPTRALQLLVLLATYVYYEVRFDLTDTLFLSNKIRARTYYQVY